MTKKLVVDKKIFAQRLKALMDEFNETVYSIAEVVHLTAPTISRYLNADMAAKITTIEVMARYFNVNPVWLMGGNVSRELEESTKTNSIAARSPEILTLKDMQLLNNFRKLNNMGQDEAVKRIEELTHIDKYIEKEQSDLLPNAAHEIEGASEEDKAHDDAIMDDDDF